MSLLIAGVMSGTSLDGIDVAIVEVGGDDQFRQLAFCEGELPAGLRDLLFALATGHENSLEQMAIADRLMGQAIAAAVGRAAADTGIAVAQLDLIASHGQTIRHRPEANPPFTLQIGCPATIAELTGVTVASDFRRRDIAAGGQGAPLVPLPHQLLFGLPGHNVALLNIGGIANITFLGADGSVCGFDTGPGNMVLDGLMHHLTNGTMSYDRNGQQAAAGVPSQPLLAQLLAHPFFAQKPPRSAGREQFGAPIIGQILAAEGVSAADQLATALALTVASVARAFEFLPARPERLWLCGGGALNPTLHAALQQRLAPTLVASTQERAIHPKAVEALAFAILGQRLILGRTTALAAVTGACRDSRSGALTPSDNWIDLIRKITHGPIDPRFGRSSRCQFGKPGASAQRGTVAAATGGHVARH